jgi:hypothetical protein
MFQTTIFPNNTSNSNINNNTSDNNTNISNINLNPNTNISSNPQNLSIYENKTQYNNQQPPQQDEPKKYKSIIELKKEINNFKNKERVYKLQLVEKQKKINELKELKSYYESIKKYHKENPSNFFRKDQLFDAKTQKLLLALKRIIEDKNSILLSLEEELYSSSPQARHFLLNQLKFLNKENSEIFVCIQGNNIENFKRENANEKNQLNALLIKIAECQENINDLLKNLDEMNDTSSMLKRKNNIMTDK